MKTNIEIFEEITEKGECELKVYYSLRETATAMLICGTMGLLLMWFIMTYVT